MEMAKFNLKEYRPPNSFAFIGRTQGELARKNLNLDSLDKTKESIELIVPKDTTSFNPSFFLGLLYNSISKLGVSDFRKKYSFVYETESASLKDILRKNIEDGIRNATNSLNNKSGLSVFQ
ncbi:hypothetical protein [Pedobacter sp.]|uniref:hypothetical protein n=1 Tax=Pedobacter sp. TaxID=1411316 RepID=UPI003D7F851A